MRTFFPSTVNLWNALPPATLDQQIAAKFKDDLSYYFISMRWLPSLQINKVKVKVSVKLKKLNILQGITLPCVTKYCIHLHVTEPVYH